MKVKELIEQLQKQNPEDNIHIWVDDEVGCGAGEFEKYYATNIDIIGHQILYQNENNIKSKSDIIKFIEDEYDIKEIDFGEQLIEEINKRKILIGTWIKIQP